MNKSHTPAHITELLELTRLAPSVHNVQPWRFTIQESTLSLFIAKNRILEAGDPTRRELWISIGICFETLLQAAESIGLTATVHSLQTDSLTKPVARITFTPGSRPRPEIAKLLSRRESYRGNMRKTEIPASFIETCEKSLQDLPGTSVAFIKDRKKIDTIADFTLKGMLLALSSPYFRKELSQLINYNWSPARIGMHGYVLNRGRVGSVWEKISMRLGLSKVRTARHDQQKVLQSSALVFILSEGDVPSFWFDAGRAYMRIALEITRAQFAHSTIAAPVEAASFHEDIEKMIGSTSRVQAMMRLGKSAKGHKIHTKTRLSVKELTT